MSTTQHPAYDVFALLDDAGRALALNSCIAAQGSKVQTAIGNNMLQLPYKPAEKLSLLSVLVPQRIAELAAIQVNLSQLASGQNIREIFAQTEDWRRLNLVWKALLDGDVETLCTCCCYGKNDIVGNGEIVSALFSKLVENAGITLLSDGSGGGAVTGTYQGNMTFLIGDKGLYVEYKHVFNKSDADRKRWIDEHTNTSAVVTGTVGTNVRGIEELKPTAEANKDAAAVKAMALEVAAKLLEFYGPKKS